MEEIKEHLHLDVMTVTGKTLGENLDDLKKNGFYKKCDKWLQEFNQRYGIKISKEDIIRPYDKAIGTDGSIAVLRGNLMLSLSVMKDQKEAECRKCFIHLRQSAVIKN